MATEGEKGRRDLATESQIRQGGERVEEEGREGDEWVRR